VEATGATDSASIIGYWNSLKAYPGYFGDYTYSPTEHNGYPADGVVMSDASSARDGTFKLAPGYKT
jgi:branched-chain amino acid transport system substrate-binding protein